MDQGGATGGDRPPDRRRSLVRRGGVEIGSPEGDGDRLRPNSDRSGCGV